MRALFLGVLWLGLSTPVGAQVAPVSADSMQALDFLVGEWSGTATFTMGPGNTSASEGTEKVRLVAGGAALAVEGVFSVREADGSERVVHNAFGVIAPDPAGDYRMRSWLADGRQMDARLERTEDGFRWGFEVPGRGSVRYTMRHPDADQWVETGEFSQDGTTWRPFMEMRLRRTRSGN